MLNNTVNKKSLWLLSIIYCMSISQSPLNFSSSIVLIFPWYFYKQTFIAGFVELSKDLTIFMIIKFFLKKLRSILKNTCFG